MIDFQVVDEFRAAEDPELPYVARALDPSVIENLIAPLVSGPGNGDTAFRVREARVVRHRPGRRCIIEYRFGSPHASADPSAPWVFGKLRAKRADARSHRLLEAFWQAGFRPGAGGVAAVPEPIGVVPELHMTIQRRVPGPVATELAGGSGSVEAMSLVAEALHELHFAGIPARRHHTLADELRILDEQLEIAGRVHPGWSQRIERILRACENLAGRLPPPSIQGIHRDFYPDQAIVDGPRITLLDLDLYAFGDPALDVGNFVAHLTEQALRCYGDPNAFCDAERAMGERYVELSSEVTQNAVRTYATLTLARHIHISTRLPTRRHTTSDIVDLCEQRLDIAQRPPPAQK